MVDAFAVHVFWLEEDKVSEVGMCWSDAEAVDTLAHAAGDYFCVE